MCTFFAYNESHARIEYGRIQICMGIKMCPNILFCIVLTAHTRINIDHDVFITAILNVFSSGLVLTY